MDFDAEVSQKPDPGAVVARAEADNSRSAPTALDLVDDAKSPTAVAVRRTRDYVPKVGPCTEKKPLGPQL